MKVEAPAIRVWLIGLGLFVLVIGLGIWLRSSSEFGIVDHQLAGTADRVNLIQTDWSANGVYWLAMFAMLGDLVFIGVYGWGSWVAGRRFMELGGVVLRSLGAAIALAAGLFLITDYLETGLQFVQLVQQQGSDPMARVAASVQGIKVASWIATFIGVLAGLLVARKSTNAA